MNIVFLLLTATAAGAEPTTYAPAVGSPTVVYPVADAEPAPEKPGFFARLRGLFRGNTAAPSEPASVYRAAAPLPPAAPMPTSIEPPALAPLPPKQPAPPQTPIAESAKKAAELDRRDEKTVALAVDYSKLTGRLSYVHIDGGLWVVRYASLGTEDANGGSVILTRDTNMENYREGDMVTVEGQITSQKGSGRLGAGLYRVQSIKLVARPLQ
jgi:hypothetical protein